VGRQHAQASRPGRHARKYFALCRASGGVAGARRLERWLLGYLVEAAMTKDFALPLLLAIGFGCGAGASAVKPDDMSAAEHRREAAAERAAAGEHARKYDPAAARPVPAASVGSDAQSSYLFPTTVYNPTDIHLAESDRHRAHARQHEKAAQALEHFEEVECRNFPPATRAACPLLAPVTRVDDIDGGVRVTLQRGARVDAVVAHMRCHYAYARARGFEQRVSCPLYMPGIDIRASRDGSAVEITAADAKAVGELRTRAREEAIYARGERP
jgi:hypothetical protein